MSSPPSDSRLSNAGRPTRLRWLAPPVAAAIGLIGLAIVPALAGAEAPPPTLPPISAHDLLVKVQQASVPGLSGTLSFKADLGLPDLGGLVPNGQDLTTSLLSGDHTAKVWVAGHDKVRVAFPTQMAESDVVANGDDVWVWQSDSKAVTHLHHDHSADATGAEHEPEADNVAPTPDALADKLLASVDPTTRVFVRDTATVAGRPTYELVLAPRSDTTLVADVVIGVDSATGLPLRLQVLSKDSGTPALDVGFTSVDFSVPGDGTFAFSPPPGSEVTEASSPAELFLPHGGAPGPERRPGRHHPAAAPGDVGPATATPETTGKPTVETKGDGWDTIVVVTPAPGTAPDAGPAGELGLIDKLATPVSGSWGSGRLLHTALLNVLFLDDGRVILGSVNEAAIEAAA